MISTVKRADPSPLNRTQSVLTLSCGHLFSWDRGTPPTKVICINCLAFKCAECGAQIKTAVDGTKIWCACDVRLITDNNSVTPRKWCELPPIEGLRCCCCGEQTRGRQWHNRDTGYGMCPSCVEHVRGQGETDEVILDLYGIQGIHWGVA